MSLVDNLLVNDFLESPTNYLLSLQNDSICIESKGVTARLHKCWNPNSYNLRKVVAHLHSHPVENVFKKAVNTLIESYNALHEEYPKKIGFLAVSSKTGPKVHFAEQASCDLFHSDITVFNSKSKTHSIVLKNEPKIRAKIYKYLEQPQEVYSFDALEILAQRGCEITATDISYAFQVMTDSRFSEASDSNWAWNCLHETFYDVIDAIENGSQKKDRAYDLFVKKLSENKKAEKFREYIENCSQTDVVKKVLCKFFTNLTNKRLSKTRVNP